jgi:DNA repair protein RadC
MAGRGKNYCQREESLGESELIAILINSGNKNKRAVELAKDILLLSKNNLNEPGGNTCEGIQVYKRNR